MTRPFRLGLALCGLLALAAAPHAIAGAEAKEHTCGTQTCEDCIPSPSGTSKFQKCDGNICRYEAAVCDPS